MVEVKALPWQLVLPQAFVHLRTTQNDLMLLLCNFQIIVSFVKISLFMRGKRKRICWNENEPLQRDRSTAEGPCNSYIRKPLACCLFPSLLKDVCLFMFYYCCAHMLIKTTKTQLAGC